MSFSSAASLYRRSRAPADRANFPPASCCAHACTQVLLHARAHPSIHPSIHPSVRLADNLSHFRFHQSGFSSEVGASSALGWSSVEALLAARLSADHVAVEGLVCYHLKRKLAIAGAGAGAGAGAARRSAHCSHRARAQHGPRKVPPTEHHDEPCGRGGGGGSSGSSWGGRRGSSKLAERVKLARRATAAAAAVATCLAGAASGSCSGVSPAAAAGDARNTSCGCACASAAPPRAPPPASSSLSLLEPEMLETCVRATTSQLQSEHRDVRGRNRSRGPAASVTAPIGAKPRGRQQEISPCQSGQNQRAARMGQARQILHLRSPSRLASHKSPHC
eukprot:364808-Chlamydomonas_euryale.AAC.1